MPKTLSINALATAALLWAGTAAADNVVADDQIVQLKKIEELTLYILQQEDRIARLEAALEAGSTR